MIDNLAIQLALRTRALTLSVATTGSMSLSATASGYARTTGSFVTDGFVRGMEVQPTGFTNNPVGTITAVAPLTLTINGGRTVETSASSRTLSVGLPSDRAWEGVQFTPTEGKPYVGEQYIPGPSSQVTMGPLGDIEFTGLYQLQVNVPANSGISADGKYADKILNLFPPRTAITLSTGDVLRVRSDVNPYRGQRLYPSPGWAVIPITIPFRLRTANSI